MPKNVSMKVEKGTKEASEDDRDGAMVFR